ncbi:nucleoside-diphosphate kinase [Stratiformator vulcanicus]|uniref:Nucleoside diphosphate kinase n=1 Tax=Stratiformator vulcanicus TaxID=2527980 RepID=A0A517R687_9PLAN|nr:nucleoside-diphosphate kinase [Stratiformator vulcanicus]QDT39406.1 Nucleoside diphosphate kinase [Stratiformator vulcanicus]
MQRTLVLIKPDAMKRRLAGRILTRLEDKGLALVGLKIMQVTPDLAKQHYAEHVAKPFYPELEEFITSGPVVAICLEGPEAITVTRGMMGKTNGRESAPGTIRGDFGMSRQLNLIHGSDSPEASDREIPLYFSDEELVGSTDGMVGTFFAGDEV